MKTTNYWYSKVFIVIVLALFLAPSVTFAAWYNPFTWSIWSIFKKSEPAVVQVETKEVNTSTPSVSTSTETKKDVAPVENKKAVVTSTPAPVQPKAEPVVQDVVVNTEVSENLAAIKSNTLKIVASRNTWIFDMNADRAEFFTSKYKDEYAPLMKVYDFVIADLKSEKDLAQAIADTIDAIPASEQAALFDDVYASYTSLLATVNATNAEKVNTLASIANLASLSKDLVKSVIQLEATNDLSSQYDGSVSSIDVQAERARLSEQADAYIKKIADTQVKLRGDSKEKVETYLKAIIYSPIGNKGWLNSR